MSPFPRLEFAVFTAALALAACEKEQEQTTTKSDAGAKKPAIDPSLAKALEGTETAKDPAGDPGAGPGAGPGGGPPPNGVFPPGEADKQLKPGARAKVDLGQEGAAPRVRIAAAPTPGEKRKAEVRFATRLLPALDLEIEMSAKKAAGVEVAEGEAGPVDVVAKVTKVTLAPSQPGAIPKQLEAEANKLKGKKVQYRVFPNGEGAAFTHDRPKDEDPVLDNALEALEVALRVQTLPVPDKPVGAGAFWMVTTRERYLGGDTVEYRLVKVEKAAAGEVELSVMVQRYAASATLEGAAGLDIIQYQTQSEGRIVLKDGDGYPSSVDYRDRTQIILMEKGAPPPQPGGPMQGVKPLQHEAVTRWALAPK